MVVIHHYSPHFGGNASEYIVPRVGPIDITSHSMGSGIYGVSDLYQKQNKPNQENSSEEYTFKIKRPFVIFNQRECDEYVEASRFIVENLEKFRVSNSFHNPYSIVVRIAIKVVKLLRFDDIDIVITAIQDFINDYLNRNDMVEMPINYILKAHNYDGVYSLFGKSCDSWSKGNVKFIKYPTYEVGDEMPVAYIYTRIGTTKNVINLTGRGGYTYTKEENVWRKTRQPQQRQITCKKCGGPHFTVQHNKITGSGAGNSNADDNGS